MKMKMPTTTTTAVLLAVAAHTWMSSLLTFANAQGPLSLFAPNVPKPTALARTYEALSVKTLASIYTPNFDNLPKNPWYLCPRGYICHKGDHDIILLQSNSTFDNVTQAEAAVLCTLGGLALAGDGTPSHPENAHVQAAISKVGGVGAAWVQGDCNITDDGFIGAVGSNPLPTSCSEKLKQVGCKKRDMSNPIDPTTEMTTLAAASKTMMSDVVGDFPTPACGGGNFWYCPRGYSCKRYGDYVYLRASSDDSRLNGAEAAAVCAINCMAPVSSNSLQNLLTTLNANANALDLPPAAYAVGDFAAKQCSVVQTSGSYNSSRFDVYKAGCEVLLGGTVCVADPKAIEYITNPEKAIEDAKKVLKDRLQTDIYQPATELWNDQAWWTCPRGYQCTGGDSSMVLVTTATGAVPGPMTGIEANALCAVNGMTATEPTTATELNDLKILVEKVYGPGVTASVWLGVNDRKTEGVYVTALNEPVSGAMWLTNEPDSANSFSEDCVVSHHHVNGTCGWATRACNEVHDAVLCKKPANNAQRYVEMGKSALDKLVGKYTDRFANSLPRPLSTFLKNNNNWWACVDGYDCLEDKEKGTKLVALLSKNASSGVMLTSLEGRALCQASGMDVASDLSNVDRLVGSQLVWGKGAGTMWTGGERDLISNGGTWRGVDSSGWSQGEPDASAPDPACAAVNALSESLLGNVGSTGVGGLFAANCMHAKAAVLCRKKDGAVSFIAGGADNVNDAVDKAKDTVSNTIDDLKEDVPGKGSLPISGVSSSGVSLGVLFFAATSRMLFLY